MPKGHRSKIKKLVTRVGVASSTAYLLSNIVSIVQHASTQAPAAIASGVVNEGVQYFNDSDLKVSMKDTVKLLTQLADGNPTRLQSTFVQVVMITDGVLSILMNIRRCNPATSTKLNFSLNIMGHLLQAAGIGLSTKGFYELFSVNDPVTSLFYNIGAYAAIKAGTLTLFLSRKAQPRPAAASEDKEEVDMKLIAP